MDGVACRSTLCDFPQNLMHHVNKVIHLVINVLDRKFGHFSKIIQKDYKFNERCISLNSSIFQLNMYNPHSKYTYRAWLLRAGP